MVVLSMINGSMSSETSSLYALRYAAQLQLPLVLVHIKGDDTLLDVEKSVAYIQKYSQKHSIQTEFILFESFEEFKEFTQKKDIDTLFCSTRNHHSVLERSFAQKLLKEKISIDIAVVKIVRLDGVQSAQKIILPIRGTKLSVKKFTIFSTFALAYSSRAEIYSVDNISKRALATVGIEKQKKRLQDIMFNLRHYFRLATLLGFKFSIKHDFELKNGELVKAHIAKNSYELAIVGAHHSTNFFGHHPIDILFEKPMINTIYFIPTKEL